jgi:alpha-mannosidase
MIVSDEAPSPELPPVPDADPLCVCQTPFKEAVRQKFKPAKKGDSFGPSWTHHWFRITLTIPESWREAERIQLEWDPSCEAMVFDGEGLPLQGITGGFGGDRRVDFILDPKSRDSTYRVGPMCTFPSEYLTDLTVAPQFFIETACNGMFGNGVPDNNDPPDQNRYFTLASADIVVPRMEAYRLLWDFRTIRDLALHLPDSSPLGTKCMEVGNTIMNTFKSTDLSTIAHSRCLVEKVFGQNWEQEGAGIFKGGIEEEGTTTLGIGNCHIDTAWLWPFSATRSKTARSWSSQIDLMRRYPEYRFVASQAQQFDWLEQVSPGF